MKSKPDHEILARYLSDECTGEERTQVIAWINHAPENAKLFELMKNAWNSQRKVSQDWDTEKVWQNIADTAGISAGNRSENVQKHKHRIIRFPVILRAAAVFLLLIIISSIYFMLTGGFSDMPDISKMNRIAALPGETEQVILSDGSVITLDSGSELYYPPEFSSESKEVVLHGEGYFEIENENSRPFRIFAANSVVEVLGTQFNIDAWEASGYVRVVVTEGKVSLKTGENDGVILSRGQMSIADKSGRISTPKNVQTDKYTGWRARQMSFVNVELTELLQRIERWYDVEIILTDTSMNSEKLSIHFNNESVRDILGLVATLTDLDMDIEGRNIKLFPKMK